MLYRRNRGIFRRYQRKVLFGLLKKDSQVNFIEAPEAHIHEDETLDHWDDAYKRNQVELATLLLVYLFFGNDGKVSWSEYRSIKRFMKDESSHLGERMRLEVASYLKSGLSQERMKDIFINKNYSMQMFDESTQWIKPLFQNQGTYFLLAERLKKFIMSED